MIYMVIRNDGTKKAPPTPRVASTTRAQATTAKTIRRKDQADSFVAAGQANTASRNGNYTHLSNNVQKLIYAQQEAFVMQYVQAEIDAHESIYVTENPNEKPIDIAKSEGKARAASVELGQIIAKNMGPKITSQADLKSREKQLEKEIRAFKERKLKNEVQRDREFDAENEASRANTKDLNKGGLTLAMSKVDNTSRSRELARGTKSKVENPNKVEDSDYQEENQVA